MAGKSQSDNFYRRQQEEANRIATAQSRTMNDIARLAKSQTEELRKLRRAFEEFAKAVLDIKTVRHFHIDAASADAAKLEMTNGDIPPEEAAANAMRAAGLGEPEFDTAAFKERIGQPYPKVDITPNDKLKKVVVGGALRTNRLGYGDVVAANDDFVNGELESGKSEEEVRGLGLVIGVDYSKADPAEVALIASRKTVESGDRWTVLCDENETRKLLLEVEAERDSRVYAEGDAEINQQRVILVERIREKINNATHYTIGAAAEMADAIRNGEHPPAMFEVPELAPVKENRDGTRSYIKQEVLPPGVTPKMMEEHPEFAERVRNSPHYHQANQDASQRAKREGGLASY